MISENKVRPIPIGSIHVRHPCELCGYFYEKIKIKLVRALQSYVLIIRDHEVWSKTRRGHLRFQTQSRLLQYEECISSRTNRNLRSVVTPSKPKKAERRWTLNQCKQTNWDRSNYAKGVHKAEVPENSKWSSVGELLYLNTPGAHGGTLTLTLASATRGTGLGIGFV